MEGPNPKQKRKTTNKGGSQGEHEQIKCSKPFFIVMETSSHIFWYAINKHEKKKSYNYEKHFKKKA
jgi:hypothetical protein